MTTKQGGTLPAAISRLAALYEFGELQASTDPAGFLDCVTEELVRLRALLTPSKPATSAPEPTEAERRRAYQDLDVAHGQWWRDQPTKAAIRERALRNRAEEECGLQVSAKRRAEVELAQAREQLADALRGLSLQEAAELERMTFDVTQHHALVTESLGNALHKFYVPGEGWVTPKRIRELANEVSEPATSAPEPTEGIRQLLRVGLRRAEQAHDDAQALHNLRHYVARALGLE